MDAKLALSLASSIDPKALASLQNRNNDPAVAKAVAAQFGSFLMQGMLQESDGSSLAMAGGTGGPAVNAMFASAMSRYAMSGDKLGLADMIYRSTAGKTQQAAAPQSGNAADAAPATVSTTKNQPALPSHASGISLMPYRLGNGHRPFGPPIGRMVTPAGPQPGKIVAGHRLDGKLATTEAANPAAAATIANAPITPAGAAKTAAATSAAAAAHPAADHSFWDWLGVPSLLRLIFPSNASLPPKQTAASVGTIPAAAPATVGANHAAMVTPATGDKGAVPYGLPWTHHQGGPETAVPNRRAAPVADAVGAVVAAPTGAQEFAQNLAPAIEQAARRLGVSRRVLLAQAALETGWGHSVVGNNIFGVKAGASWSGATVTAKTHEMEGGRLVAHQGSFRSYDNVGQAVDDYVALVSASNRYRSALGAGDDVTAYAQALAAGGYATDRNYAAKLTAVADGPTMSDAVASLNEHEPGQLVSAHG